MIEPRIETLPAKKLIGKHLKMSLSANRTGELWQSFMVRRKTIGNSVGTALYSIQVFDQNVDVARDFTTETMFEKWAAIEVTDFNVIPAEMEPFELPGGLYAVFLHKGGPSTGPQTFHYIFANWLPASDYSCDNRPHFELLGEKYKNDDPDSEEEIWVPIKRKKE